MRFMLQLNLAGLPGRCETTPREGLLSFFYCSVDDGDCETWAPFSGCHSLAIFPASSFSTLKLRSGGPSPFQRKFIRGWDEVTDLPDPGDHEACGILSTFNRAAHIRTFDCASEGIHLDDVDGGVFLRDVAGTALEHDKLGGWPMWVQTPERPPCPVCQTEMSLVMQVDSHDHLDYMFGDHGCGHIMQCHKHPEQLAFSWACM